MTRLTQGVPSDQTSQCEKCNDELVLFVTTSCNYVCDWCELAVLETAIPRRAVMYASTRPGCAYDLCQDCCKIFDDFDKVKIPVHSVAGDTEDTEITARARDMQVRAEDSTIANAKSTMKPSVVFCDRGVVPTEECFNCDWEDVLKTRQLSNTDVLKRYDLVLHIGTADTVEGSPHVKIDQMVEKVCGDPDKKLRLATQYALQRGHEATSDAMEVTRTTSSLAIQYALQRGHEATSDAMEVASTPLPDPASTVNSSTIDAKLRSQRICPHATLRNSNVLRMFLLFSFIVKAIAVPVQALDIAGDAVGMVRTFGTTLAIVSTIAVALYYLRYQADVQVAPAVAPVVAPVVARIKGKNGKRCAPNGEKLPIP